MPDARAEPTFRVRPHRMPALVTAAAALCAVPALLAVVLPRRPGDPVWGCLLLLGFAWTAWRSWHVGLDVDAESVVHRGWFATRRHPRAAVEAVHPRRYLGYFSGHKPGRGLSMVVLALTPGPHGASGREVEVRELVGRDHTVHETARTLGRHLGLPATDTGV